MRLQRKRKKNYTNEKGRGKKTILLPPLRTLGLIHTLYMRQLMHTSKPFPGPHHRRALTARITPSRNALDRTQQVRRSDYDPLVHAAPLICLLLLRLPEEHPQRRRAHRQQRRCDFHHCPDVDGV